MFPVVVVGLLVVLVLRSSAQASTQADPCDQLEDPKAVLACKLARGVLGSAYDALRDAVAGEDRHVVNSQLNGPAVEWFDSPENDDAYYASGGDGFGTLVPTRYTDAQRGPNGEKRPKRHENGCVPLPGHRDFAKCKPGTKSMAADRFSHPGHGPVQGSREGLRDWEGSPARNGGALYSPDAVGSGDPQRDPLTFPWSERPSGYRYAATEPHRDLDFPLEVPDGHTAWIVAGEPVVCPPGSEIVGRDHRTGAETRSPCSVRQEVDAPPVVDDREPRSGDECLRYYTADGRNVRDCREGATLPPGASTTPPLGKTGTARLPGVSISGFR